MSGTEEAATSSFSSFIYLLLHCSAMYVNPIWASKRFHNVRFALRHHIPHSNRPALYLLLIYSLPTHCSSSCGRRNNKRFLPSGKVAKPTGVSGNSDSSSSSVRL